MGSEAGTRDHNKVLGDETMEGAWVLAVGLNALANDRNAENEDASNVTGLPHRGEDAIVVRERQCRRWWSVICGESPAM